ncbi:MAG: hypothetical protein JSR21_10725 [Proteobacteria bacterium]|nr:hypothetical protein [Pseudomonadota bacterium]
MTPYAFALGVLACSFGAGLFGMVLHVRLPDHHLDTESCDVVKLVMGLIATMAALVLSLLIASASSSYNSQASELNGMLANIQLLDRTLALYGPDAKAARDRLHDALQSTHDRIWSSDGVRPEALNSAETQRLARADIEELQNLSPKTDAQRMMQSRAVQEAESISRSRLVMFGQLGDAIPWPFLTVMVFWISVIFLGFGLFSRFNPVVIIAMFVGSLSVAGALFLILELNQPYRGVMRLSDIHLRDVIAQIGK